MELRSNADLCSENRLGGKERRGIEERGQHEGEKWHDYYAGAGLICNKQTEQQNSGGANVACSFAVVTIS
jgi:hypothetical protein